jgi:hypothetical protein
MNVTRKNASQLGLSPDKVGLLTDTYGVTLELSEQGGTCTLKATYGARLCHQSLVRCGTLIIQAIAGDSPASSVAEVSAKPEPATQV